MSNPLKLTELVLRDAHQSLLATRMRIDDMLPIAEKLDKSIRTIETHRFNIMKKLEVNNITELLKKVDRESIL